MANICGKSWMAANRVLGMALNPNATRSKSSWFADVKMGPPDTLLDVTGDNLNSINLVLGAYSDDNGKPWVLPSVRMAEERIVGRKMDHEHASIIGIPDFYNKAVELALGKDSNRLKEKHNATTQTISGTGALSLGAAFLIKFFEGNREIYVPTPTYINHIPIFEHSGLTVKKYRYYDAKTCGLDFQGCMDDIKKIPPKSIVLLHACAHNPTGVDPTKEQWLELSNLIKKNNLYPFFDMAYQGFASGDVNHDAQAVRIFEKDGHEYCLAQSFSKNMGLYGERAGAYTVVTSSKEEADRVMSQIKILIRALYSNPPIHGARIVSEILNDQELHGLWLKDVKLMADRIINVRAQLQQNLVKLGSSRPWDHITNHIGMFCYSGMSAENVDRLMKEFRIYLTKDGRISMAGVTSKNVDYLAHGMHEVTK